MNLQILSQNFKSLKTVVVRNILKLNIMVYSFIEDFQSFFCCLPFSTRHLRILQTSKALKRFGLEGTLQVMCISSSPSSWSRILYLPNPNQELYTSDPSFVRLDTNTFPCRLVVLMSKGLGRGNGFLLPLHKPREHLTVCVRSLVTTVGMTTVI